MEGDLLWGSWLKLMEGGFLVLARVVRSLSAVIGLGLEGGLLLRSWLKLTEGGQLRIFGLGLTEVGWLWRSLLKLTDG
jgi:hypothetical protein